MSGQISFEQLIELFRQEVPAAEHLLVAYSGGLDSSLLLHTAASAFPNREITAIHCNHQVSSNAAKWQTFCEQQSKTLKTNFVVENLTFRDGFTEERGRKARLATFSKYMRPGIVLLLGHHAQDQAETFMFRLFRGTGLRGLTGMQKQRPFSQGQMIRPFLAVSKRELHAIAMDQGIKWVEDESNQSNDYDRNYIRQAIIPKVLNRWPDAQNQIQKTMNFLAEDYDLLNDYADKLITDLDFRDESYQQSLSLEKLALLDKKTQNLVLRRWLFKKQGSQPNARDINELVKQVLLSSADTEPEFFFGDTVVRRFKQRAYLMAKNLGTAIDKNEVDWDGSSPLKIEGLGEFHLIEGNPGPFKVCFRQGGERAKPFERDHSQTLKKLYQEYQVEPWLRDSLPIVYLDNQIINIGGRIQCNGHQFKLRIE